MLKFKNNEQSLSNQFNETISSKLNTILYAAAGYVEYNFNKDFIITSLVRLDKPVMIHYAQRAADAEIVNLTLLEATMLRDFLNSRFPYGKSNLQTCIIETTGEVLNGSTSTGPHFHIQTII